MARFLFFICWSIFYLNAHADLPISGLLSTAIMSGDKADVSAPDPGTLTADWWKYFDVEETALEERIKHISASLRALNDTTEESQQSIERLIANLQIYRGLKEKSVPEPPAAAPLQDNYSLKQWLDIVHKQKTLQVDLQSTEENLRRDEKQIKFLQNQLDSLTAAYLSKDNKVADKNRQGLSIMLAWSDLATKNQQFRLQKAAAQVQAVYLEQLVQASTAAQSRLQMSDDELRDLENKIKDAELRREAAQTYLAKMEAARMTENLADDQGKAQGLLFEQQLRHAAINAAIAEGITVRRKIELKLAKVLTSTDKSELKGLKRQLRFDWDTLSGIINQLETWQDELENEQDLAGKALAALYIDNEKQNPELIQLTQKRLAEVQNSLLSIQKLSSGIEDSRLLADHIQTLLIDTEGGLAIGFDTVKTSSSKAIQLLWDNMKASLFKIGETPITALGIFKVLFIATVAWLISHFIRRGLTHLSERQPSNSTFLYTLGRLTHYLILIIGISIGLSSVGIDLSNFALIAGALSLGIGFGLQAIVNNFVSGLIVLFERSLRIGDFVELSSGLAGEVKAINVRSTLVTTTDMVEILVPNSEFVNGQVINWTLTDASRRIHIPFGVAYGTDKELVKKAGLEAAYNTPHTLRGHRNREPEVWLVGFGNNSLDFELVVWVHPQAVKKPQKVRAAYYWELETALKQYGISIPFPQRDLHIKSGLSLPLISEQTEENFNHKIS